MSRAVLAALNNDAMRAEIDALKAEVTRLQERVEAVRDG